MILSYEFKRFDGEFKSIIVFYVIYSTIKIINEMMFLYICYLLIESSTDK